MARYIDADLLYVDLWYNSEVWKDTDKGVSIEQINNAPTADVQEVKHGHWVRWYEEQKNEYGETHIPHCKCSECNKEFDTAASLSMKFCSNCGAQMDEEVE